MNIRLTKASLPLLWSVWFLALVCFLFGLFLPIMSIRQFYLFEDQFSILSALLLLVKDGQVILAVIIFLFSVVMPLFKFCAFASALFSYQKLNSIASRAIDWIHRFGRWSMLDVFVVAVLIVGVKLSAFASVELHLGLWAFSGALMLLLVLTSMVQRLQVKDTDIS